MIVALIDNGSLEPAAHRNLRAVAAALSQRCRVNIHPVSWKHSDRNPPESLDGTPAWTLAPFVRAMVALGQREFVFVPFFISPQGAIGSALRRNLESLQREVGGFEFVFTDGLAARDAIPTILCDQIRAAITAHTLHRPAVIVVDHGGPSPASAELRNALAAKTQAMLGAAIGPLAPASMEGDEFSHNRPLFADQLGAPEFDRGNILIAPLFLSPGRHAGAEGDLTRIARQAEQRLASRGFRCHFTGLVGTHPLVVDTLADILTSSLSSFHAQIFA